MHSDRLETFSFRFMVLNLECLYPKRVIENECIHYFSISKTSNLMKIVDLLQTRLNSLVEMSVRGIAYKPFMVIVVICKLESLVRGYMCSISVENYYI